MHTGMWAHQKQPQQGVFPKVSNFLMMTIPAAKRKVHRGKRSNNAQLKRDTRRLLINYCTHDHEKKEILCTQNAVIRVEAELAGRYEHMTPTCVEPGEVLVDSQGSGTFQKEVST